MTAPGTARPTAPPREAAIPALHVRALPADRREAAGEIWRTVEATQSDANPFAGWEWTQLWLRQFGPVVTHEFLVVERAGEPVGAALLTRDTRRHGPVTLRRLHLGTAGEPRGESVAVEYNGLCAAEADRPAVGTALLGHLRARRGWDEIHLDGFDPRHAAPLLAAAPGATPDVRPSPMIALDGPAGPGCDGLVATLPSRSARAAVRRSLRGLEPYEASLATTAEQALAALDVLVELHQARWQAAGKPGAFASERFTAFHRELVARWVPQGRAVLFTVRSGDETVAALYGFVRGDSLQFYQGGFRPGPSPKVRTGYAAHLLMADAARELGLACYEYLAGESRYKDELSTGHREITWASLRARTPRVLALQAARGAVGRMQALRGRRAGEA